MDSNRSDEDDEVIQSTRSPSEWKGEYRFIKTEKKQLINYVTFIQRAFRLKKKASQGYISMSVMKSPLRTVALALRTYHLGWKTRSIMASDKMRGLKDQVRELTEFYKGDTHPHVIKMKTNFLKTFEGEMKGIDWIKKTKDTLQERQQRVQKARNQHKRLKSNSSPRPNHAVPIVQNLIVTDDDLDKGSLKNTSFNAYQDYDDRPVSGGAGLENPEPFIIESKSNSVDLSAKAKKPSRKTVKGNSEKIYI